jgi:hypothetical protein
MNMRIAVWDTYVIRKDGKIMHFDILVDENQKIKKIIFDYGKDYLKSVMQEGQNLTSKECNFCHIDKASEEVEQQILKSGFSIIEMENCN